MKLVKTKSFIVFICIMAFVQITKAQQVNTLYFLENAPMRHNINPAFQPLSNVYVSLPILGYTSLWAGNNSLTLSDFVYNQNGQTITFMHPNGNKDKFYKRLSQTVSFDIEGQFNLLSFGWRWKEAYWHVTLNERIEGSVGIPRDLFKFGLYGMDDLSGPNNYNLTSLGTDVSVYTEFGIGHSRNINDKWAVGGKVKFLYGTANLSTKMNQLNFVASPEEWAFKGDGQLRMSVPLEYMPTQLENISNLQLSKNWQDWVKPSGLGLAFDLGATYKPIDRLTLSFSVTDLGFIRWGKRNGYFMNSSIDAKYDGVGELDLADFEATTDSIIQYIKEGIVYTTDSIQHGPYNLMLYTKINIGAEFNFWDERVSVGLHSRTKFANKKVYEELTLGASFKPTNWFNLAASYSLTNGRYSSLGAAIGLRGGPFNLTLMADYIPFSYADYTTESGMNMPIPYQVKGLNVGFGLNLVFGNKQDKDKDGVRNRKDICPNTPRGVMVDQFGCPVDTDGDGVPDYLDQCPNTPQTTWGFVDQFGCPIDTDGDGVADYLDRCPDTPEAAWSLLDEHGCPLDSDGDGVPDYMDLCPETTHIAWGFVDENGCPLDTDGDGVPDYLDRCIDTPLAALGRVDEYGCPLDTDEDGIPDYLDKCPDTSEAARKFVDANGCDLDTDEDDVPDYMDNCPRTPGTVSNHGCPEVKTEVRNLFKKALQGIQFETGKDIIKTASYPILRQIANVLHGNPTYLIEIQGHTDNVGKAEMNQILSEKRANAVRYFLIKEGVSEDRITAIGYGDTMPVTDNKTAVNRSKNRRVEFIISFEEITYE